MCGIAGVIPRTVFASDDAAELLATLAPRGPDDQGWVVLHQDAPERGRDVPQGAVWTDPVLLHRRLSILDLSDAGHQPMASPDERFHIVYNGEVYNFKELRNELQALGHAFRSDSDTEVVLAAYREWGRGMLDRFVGMFAIAIVDREQGTLFLARDHLGVKPLYHAAGDWGFAFASDIPSILKVPGVSRVADPGRVRRYLTTSSGISSYGEDTMFRDVKQVPPGHWLEVDLVSARPTAPVSYWSPVPAERRRVPYDEAVKEVRRLFLESVRIQLRSDVPVGAALSGGIDSSAIVSAVRQQLGDEAPIHTFSYLADDPNISEERWVRIVEKEKGTRGHGVTPSVAALKEDLPALVRAQGEPFGSSSIYAQYCVFQAAAAAGIHVVLDGQGADEILAGYRGYYPPRVASLLRRGRFVKALRLYRRMSREPGVKAAGLRVEALALALPAPAVRLLRRVRSRQAQAGLDWLDGSWFDARATAFVPPAAEGRDVMRDALLASVTENSLPHLLRYADRNSMAHSVESRVPFLDHRLVSYVLSLPEAHIVGDDATTKRVFRDAMRGLVPDAVLDRRDKVGFQTTEKAWMVAHDEWVRATLDSPTAHRIPFLRPDQMLATWEDIKAGREAYSWTVWRWISLIEWTRLFDVVFDEADVPRSRTATSEPASTEVPAPAMQPSFYDVTTDAPPVAADRGAPGA